MGATDQVSPRDGHRAQFTCHTGHFYRPVKRAGPSCLTWFTSQPDGTIVASFIRPYSRKKLPRQETATKPKAGFSFCLTLKLHKTRLDAPHTGFRCRLKGKTGCPSHKPAYPETQEHELVLMKRVNRRDSLLQPDMTEILKPSFHPGNWNRGRITPRTGEIQ